MNSKNIILIGVLLSILSVRAQIVTYNGLGRTYIADDYFTGALIDKDTVSPSSGTGGYFLFDLGLNIHPSDALKVSTILRSKMTMGGFFGDGSSFEFRQFKISGILGKQGKGVKYEMGDLNLELSPFTLYNNEESFHKYEADVFAKRREIVSYENFNSGNTWRLQGVNLSTKFLFDNVIDNATVQVFGTRLKNSINFQSPDRFFMGSRLKLVKNENLSVASNFAYLTDAKSTINTDADQYNNGVVTGEVVYNKDINDNKVLVELESGVSFFKFHESATDATTSLNDYLHQLQLSYGVSKLNLEIGLGYRSVGYDFISAGSQTRRIYDQGVPSTFGAINSGTDFRMPTIFDRYSQESIYNQMLSPVLMSYNPRYNLVSPYGVATPNRQGFTLELNSIDAKKWFAYEVKVDKVKEIVGEGIANKRDFTLAQIGTKVKLNQVLKTKKELNLIGGVKSESVTRADDLVGFSNLSFDAGIDYEVVTNFFLQGAYKTIISSGKENIGVRNQANEITSYKVYGPNQLNSDITENVVSMGVKYNFAKHSVFSLSAHLMDLHNNNNEAVNYTIRQYFVGYTLKF